MTGTRPLVYYKLYEVNNDDFEINNRLSKWAYDQQNSIYENGDFGIVHPSNFLACSVAEGGTNMKFTVIYIIYLFVILYAFF